jgi:predicted nucleic acid-binding protein
MTTRPASRWFIDTNVLAYLKDGRAPLKQGRCEAWLKAILEHGDPSLSPQVINELVRVLTQKSPLAGDLPKRLAFVRGFLDWCDAPLDAETCRVAMDLYEHHRLFWWDCVLIASAIQIEADYLLSEDLQEGRRFGRLQIVDPFRNPPDVFFAAAPAARPA